MDNDSVPASDAVRSALRTVLPEGVKQRLRTVRTWWVSRTFAHQRLHPMRIGSFELAVPSRHILRQLTQVQPYRDQAIGIIAGQAGLKYPDLALVDVGANIGDTAARMASHASNSLILVEPSDYFFRILRRNAEEIPNETLLLQSLVGDGSTISGSLDHWGGTAEFMDSETGPRVPTRRLSDIATAHQLGIALVKIDTDGFDFKIVLSSIDWLAETKPALFFEVHVRSEGALSDANMTFGALAQIGYRRFLVWDDAGLHMLTTDSVAAVADLNRYLFKNWESPDTRKSVFNYDVLCLSATDSDIAEALHAYYSTY